MARAKAVGLFEYLDRAEKWTGGKELMVREPGCPECGTPLVAASVEMPALFIHGGYGATKKVTWAICPDTECRWSVEHTIEEIAPEEGDLRRMRGQEGSQG